MADYTTIEQLKDLVYHIIEIYNDSNLKWDGYSKNHGLIPFNQRSTEVVDLRNDIKKSQFILNYIDFLVNLEIQHKVESMTTMLTLSARIKNENSIDENLTDYCDYRIEKGKFEKEEERK